MNRKAGDKRSRNKNENIQLSRDEKIYNFQMLKKIIKNIGDKGKIEYVNKTCDMIEEEKRGHEGNNKK